MKMIIDGKTLDVLLENNSSADALVELLKKGDITVDMSDYDSMEKVGSLPQSLPRNDKPTKTTACDVILYMGNALVIYYDNNSWNFTKLGRIQNLTQQELISILGRGDVEVRLTLN